MARPDWLLIDGSSLIFRAFYGVPKTALAPDGRLVNAVRGFTETLARLVQTRKPVHLAIAADADWRPQRRVNLIPSYKEHRAAEPVPAELVPQLPIIDTVIAAVGIDFVGVADLEAEDVIASWVEQMEGQIEIVSGDRDLFALVRSPSVSVLYPEQGRWSEIGESEITERYGIPGRAYGDFAALRGDPSDGLPGLKGVGAVGAAALIKRYRDLDGLLASGTLSESQHAYLLKAREVVRPGSPHPVPVPAGRRDMWPRDPTAVERLGVELGIASSINTLITAIERL